MHRFLTITTYRMNRKRFNCVRNEMKLYVYTVGSSDREMRFGKNQLFFFFFYPTNKENAKHK